MIREEKLLFKKRWMNKILKFISEPDLDNAKKKKEYAEFLWQLAYYKKTGEKFISSNFLKSPLAPDFLPSIQEKMIEIQNEIRKLIDYVKQKVPPPYELPTVKQTLFNIDGYFAIQDSYEFKDGDFWPIPLTRMKRILCQIIEGLEVNFIKTCPACGKCFAHMTKRKNRIYCTPQCASRHNVRQKRNKLKGNARKWKAYQKKQKQYKDTWRKKG